MRFKLIFRREVGHFLPFNYQHPLASWIYKVLEKANADYAQHLHDQGYESANGRKRYKLFSFGLLRLRPPFKTLQAEGGFELGADYLDLSLSFYLDEASNRFVQGLFLGQRLVIQGKNGEPDLVLRVFQVETQSLPNFKPGVQRFTALSPICLSTSKGLAPGQQRYIGPDWPAYEAHLRQGLWNKYESLRQLHPELPAVSAEDIQLRITGPSKSKLIAVKSGRAEEAKVRGYLYRLLIQAPEEVLRLAYLGGLGEKNSMGFGHIETY